MAKKRSTRASADDGADGWVVRAPDPVADRHAVFDLAAKTFGRPYFGFYDFCRDVYCVDPVFDWARSRVGTLDGGLATLWGVWDHTIRVGRARLRVAGIGCVACRADLRGRGLLSKTARPSLDACQAAGYPLSMLFGIPDFYHRFDYVRAFDNVRFSSSPEALAALAGPGGARFAPTADMKPARVDESRRAEIDALYNAAHADAAGTLVRPFLPGRFPGDKYHSSRDRFRDAFYGWTADPKRPALAGYVGVEWNADAARLTVVECAGSVADALGAVLAIARDWTAREVVWDTIPPQGEMARTLRLGTVTETVEHVQNRGPMVRTLSLAAALTALAPELSARWRARAAKTDAWLRVADARETVFLRLDRRGVRVAAPDAAARRTRHHITGGPELAQLLLGTYALDDMRMMDVLKTGGDAADWGAALFPARAPTVARLDHY